MFEHLKVDHGMSVISTRISTNQLSEQSGAGGGRDVLL